ncbi:MAG: hypothetical protein A3G75_08565 [Verrucomicrobia bacterium RIFCSPLOWO2_12_FULL_64_8]|nr:MAG: hypothetical protein A3G75_08565 [Verrucomicrobia bacterium RIFCSPLOWO2_12_FULL_64_8]
MPFQSQPFRFGAVILAAGASTRMGEPKQLLRIGDRTLLRRAIDAALASAAWPVVVVLGAHLEKIRPESARLPVLVVENPDWEEGLSTSIRAGVRVLDAFSLSLQAGVFVLCDQPCLSAGVFAQLADVHSRSGKTIVATRYVSPGPDPGGGHLGPPALFARRHFHELQELRGLGGAKPLFERHADALAAVTLPELAVDLDTPEDCKKFFATTTPAPKKI